MTQLSNRDINANPNEESIDDIELKLKQGLKSLLARWKVIVLAIVIGGGLGLAYAVLKKPVYKATLSFALEDDKASGGGGLGAALGLASQFGIDLGGGGGGAFSGDNLLELMKSRSMIEKSLLTDVTINGKRQTLAELYIDFNKLRDKWKEKEGIKDVHFLPGADPDKFSLKQDSLLGEFHKELIKSCVTVDKADKKLSIISVVVSSKSELFSKFFAEVLVKNVSDFYVTTKTKKSTQNVMVLQRQTDSVRRELNSAILGVASNTDRTPNPNPNLQILRTPSQRKQVDVQANTAILTELVKNLEITKLSLRKETPLVQIIDKPILPLEKSETSVPLAILIGTTLGAFLSVFVLFFLRPVLNIVIRSF
jgi:hypothetical protein